MSRYELAELREERGALYDQMGAMLDQTKVEKRDLTFAETQKYNRLQDRFDELAVRIELEERKSKDGPVRANRMPNPALEDVPLRGADGEVRGPARHRADGLLGAEQRMADWAAAEHRDESGFTAADADEFCLGNIMRAQVDPAFRKQLTDVEQRALAEGVDAQGGFLTPELLSVNVIDRIRNSMQVIKAGATTVPINSDKQSIPRLTTGVTGAWRNENAAFTQTQPAFDRVTFTPQSYGFLVLISEELFQDMVPNAGQILTHEFAQAAALELDRAALRGSGTAPEPRGVRNQSGVTIQSLGTNGGNLTAYSDLLTAVTTLQSANRQPDGVILAPRTNNKYAGMQDTLGQPLRPPQPVADLPFRVSGQVPVNVTQGTATNTSEIYVGEWGDLLIGVRLGMQLRLLQERYADTGQFAWRVFMRLDIQLAHPESFVVITGVLP